MLWQARAGWSFFLGLFAWISFGRDLRPSMHTESHVTKSGVAFFELLAVVSKPYCMPHHVLMVSNLQPAGAASWTSTRRPWAAHFGFEAPQFCADVSADLEKERHVASCWARISYSLGGCWTSCLRRPYVSIENATGFSTLFDEAHLLIRRCGRNTHSM